MLTYRTETLGCKVNQYETRELEEVLERAGLVPAAPAAAADLVLVNTCVVTAEAARQCRQTIRRLRRENPAARLIVTGCYAAESERAELATIAGLDLILADKDELRRRLAAELASSNPSPSQGEVPASAGGEGAAGRGGENATGISRFEGHARAFVKIQDGCDQFCSYCIVPLVRPQLWSRPADEVVAEVRRLVAAGHREIVLSGIHLGRYGRETPATTGVATRASPLVALLAQLVELQEQFRLRLSSLEAVEVDGPLLDLMAAHAGRADESGATGGRICPHLHLPLQSGDDAVLRAMRRPYTADEFLERVAAARAAIAGLAVTADVIVGFPGESAAAFDRTCRVVERAALSRLHVFPYSPRRGTPAAAMADQVPGPERRRRAARLRELGERLAARFAAGLVGRQATVLVESAGGSDGAAEGFEEHYVRTALRVAPGRAVSRGELVRVKVVECRGAGLLGEVI